MLWYTVVPAHGSIWHIDPSSFADSLRRTWPQVVINPAPDPVIARALALDPATMAPVALDWEITWESRPTHLYRSIFVSGQLAQDHQRIDLTGDFEQCVTFVLWYRTVVPPDSPVFFHDEPKTHEIEIRSDTTKRQVLKIFEPTLDPFEWHILQLLDETGGIAEVGFILDAVCAHGNDTAEELKITRADTSLTHLWRESLISSPSVKWLTIRPEVLTNVFANAVKNAAYRGYRLSLTDTGKRALIAKAA